jgi:hypothetical protein
MILSPLFGSDIHTHQLYINNDELQDPRARAQGGNDSAIKHSHFGTYHWWIPKSEPKSGEILHGELETRKTYLNKPTKR